MFSCGRNLIMYPIVKLSFIGEEIGRTVMPKSDFEKVYTPKQQSTLIAGGEIKIDGDSYVKLIQGEVKPNTTEILNQRQSQYGDYADVATITQTIVNSLQTGASYSQLSDAQKTSLFMIANKMARAVNGDVTYKDNYEDICGYSQLVLDELNKK